MGNERRSYLLIHLFLSLEETKNETMTHARALRCPPILHSTSSLLQKPQFRSELQLTQQKTLTFPDSFVANSQVTQFWSIYAGHGYPVPSRTCPCVKKSCI